MAEVQLGTLGNGSTEQQHKWQPEEIIIILNVKKWENWKLLEEFKFVGTYSYGPSSCSA